MPRLPKEQLHEERKKQIIQAAIHVFSRWGVSKAKMSKIADEAGISHGLIYHYFKSKEELFNVLIEQAAKTSVTEIENLVRHAPGSPLEKIRLLTEVILDENASPVFMLLHQARNSEDVPEKAKQLIEQYPMEIYVESLLPLFKEGQETGEIVDGNLKELISTYFTVLSGVMVLGNGYTIPNPKWILRMITNSHIK